MRKYRILLCMLLIMGISSCDKFLNVTPKNVISMDDMESIKKALAGFLNNIANARSGITGKDIPWSPFGYIYGGLMDYTTEVDLSRLPEKEFTDDEVRRADWRSTSTQSFWGSFYGPIGLMNLIIHESATATGEEDMRDYVMGEAYVIRAYCFFKLVQFYAPYKDNQLGIPVCLETYEDFEDVSVKRSTQKEVYAQILSDIHEAEIRLARTNSRGAFNIMYASSVINRLLAQIYHFKALSAAAAPDDWTKAILYASKETTGKKLESNPAALKKIFKPNSQPVLNDAECALRVYTEGSGFSGTMQGLVFDQSFYQTYFPADEGDIRRDLYFKVSGNNLQCDKYSTFSDYWNIYWYYTHFGFRLAETFLIQAEALVMSDQLPEAKEILTKFKQARYTQVFTIPEGREALLQDIYRERRKEFVAEGDVSWLDMKRLGVIAEREIGGITFKLTGEGDYRYTFPIPQSEIKLNKEIWQNPGWILND